MLPLILIIKEHEGIVWAVLQSEQQAAAPPILSLSLTAARIREMKIQNFESWILL